MYLILNHTGRIMDISEDARYVKRQENDVIVGCDKQEAEAIYSANADAFFPLKPTGYIGNGHTLITVEEVPPEVVAGYYFYHAGEFYTTKANLSALAKAQAPELANLIFVKLAEAEEFNDAVIAKHPEQFSEWAYPVNHTAGTICRYEGKLYRCLQSHTSQDTWTPAAVPSQWKEIGNPTGEWPEWSQPVGAIDTYPLGAKVSHNGKRWISTVDNNVWEPGVYGWTQNE